MASRVKEDERNERIIRGLLKLPENRRCMNCNSLGPQYVCTNFWIFVCTTCGGIHREFTHRVKSVSMAKFTSQEVSALQEKGNKHAKEIFFKEWDPQRHSSPDRSNVERLRDFIKKVYVDRRYSAEKNFEKPPRAKMSDGEDSWGGSRSPPYEDTYERRYSERSSPGGKSDENNSRYGYDERRSPGYEQETRQYRDSPVRPDIVNDWRREDKFGNGKKFEDRGTYDGDLKLEGKSPERKDLETSSPVARPVREILRETVVPRISEPSKANNVRVPIASANTQRTASSSSMGSIKGNPMEAKLGNFGSLIDFDSNPEPPGATVTQAHPTATAQSTAQPTNNNWASFDLAPEANVSHASNANPLEYALSQLSISTPAPAHSSGMPGSAGAPTIQPPGNTTAILVSGNSTGAPLGYGPMFPVTVVAPASAPMSSSSTILPGGGVSTATHGFASMVPLNGTPTIAANDAGQWPNMHHQQPSLFPSTDSQFTAQQYVPSIRGASSNQPLNLSIAPNAYESLNSSAVQAPQYVSNPPPDVTYGVLPRPSHAEVKLNERKELPQDLFTVNYPSMSAPVPWWRSGPPLGMGHAMQYNSGVPMQNYLYSSKASNPFALGDQPHLVQAPTFPPMALLQGDIPNRPPSSLMYSSSAPLPTWMPPHSVSNTALPPHASTGIPAPYMGQQVHGDIPPSRHQSVGGFGSNAVGFGSFNLDQQPASRYSSTSAAPNPFSSVGGNPFG